MSEDNRIDCNAREIVSVREHLESEIGHVKETMRVFKDTIEARMVHMNEMRAQIDRERGLSLFRPEHDAVHKALESTLDSIREDIVALQLSRAELAGKATMTAVYWTGSLAFGSLLLGVISVAISLIH